MLKILKNWKVVILSLVGATTFWFFNALNKNYDANITYPIEFIFERDSFVVVEPLPSNIRLNVSSGGWNLLRKTFWFNLPPVEIELENPQTVRYIDRGALFPIVVNQMSELRVNYIVNDSLFLKIQKRDSIKVKLRLYASDIPLKPGFRITSRIRIEPDSALLTGPMSFIDTLEDEYLLKMGSTLIDRSIDQKVFVNLPSHLTSSTPAEVLLKFDVQEFVQDSIQLRMEVSGVPSNFAKYPESNHVTLTYFVAKSSKRNFSPNEFAVFLDLSMMNKTDSTVTPIILYYPQEVVDPEVIPSEIKILYEK